MGARLKRRERKRGSRAPSTLARCTFLSCCCVNSGPLYRNELLLVLVFFFSFFCEREGVHVYNEGAGRFNGRVEWLLKLSANFGLLTGSISTL